MQLLVMGPVRMPTKVLNISTRKSPLWRKKPVNSSVWDSWGAMVLAVVYGLVYNCAVSTRCKHDCACRPGPGRRRMVCTRK